MYINHDGSIVLEEGDLQDWRVMEALKENMLNVIHLVSVPWEPNGVGVYLHDIGYRRDWKASYDKLTPPWKMFYHLLDNSKYDEFYWEEDSARINDLIDKGKLLAAMVELNKIREDYPLHAGLTALDALILQREKEMDEDG